MVYIGFLLVGIHIFLFIWGCGGFLEMILSKVPWKPFTNPEFPAWVLLIHWASVVFASAIFLFGYFTHWSKTPQLMAWAYCFMALVCVIETFGYMTSKTKYLAMGLEYAAYIIILFLLFKTRYFSEYFTR